MPVLALRASARRVFWSSVSGTAERTWAMTRLPSVEVFSSRRVDDLGELVHPTGGHDQRDEPDGRRGGLALEHVLDDLLAAFDGQVRVGEGVSELVGALDDPSEAEQLVDHLVGTALGVQDVEEGIGVELDAVAHVRDPTVVM